jgi:hypothetical protein
LPDRCDTLVADYDSGRRRALMTVTPVDFSPAESPRTTPARKRVSSQPLLVAPKKPIEVDPLFAIEPLSRAVCVGNR